MLGPSLSVRNPLAPTSFDAIDPLDAEHHHIHSTRHGHATAFGVMTATTPTTVSLNGIGSGLALDESAYKREYEYPDAACLHRPRQWAGMPIRAVVPLPRRARLSGLNVNTPSVVSTSPSVVTPQRWTRSVHIDCDDEEDTDAEDAGRHKKDEKEVDGRACCSYQSISASEGLGAWSFEELRVECYAQSLVARGSKPPLVTQPSLAIPPAFVPRIVRT